MKKNQDQTWLALGALGVVFGDIGTSPLYALSEIFISHGEVVHSDATTIIGVLSLIIWALILVISIKYLQIVVRASNDGEGGVFALYGLLYRFRGQKKYVAPLLTLLILSAGFLFGDGMITPAISVLSAVEGLKFTVPGVDREIVPIAMLILILLFSLQKKGTHSVGRVFGPVLLIWFGAIGYLGVFRILEQPAILQAFNPLCALAYLHTCSLSTLFVILGGVILAITGGEALYADMGHFNTLAIRQSWFCVVFPALLLNYLGQGAYLLSGRPVLFNNIFYSSVPEEFRFAMLVLATVATVIASQALISGVFSLTTQAVALGLFPRLSIRYTHHKHSGQVYVPVVNWSLLAGCLALVAFFKASQNLASAYGLAVSVDMFLTSMAIVAVSQANWKWTWFRSLMTMSVFAIIDLSFLFANSVKLFEGGYIPLGIGLALFFVMTTWRWGRKSAYAGYSAVHTMKVGEFAEWHRKEKSFAQKNLLLLVPKPIQSLEQNTPALLQMVVERHGALANNIFFVEVLHKKVPYLDDDRYDVKILEKNANGMIASVAVKFGFMEDPNVEHVLEGIAKHDDIHLDPDTRHWVFHVSHETLKGGGRPSTWKKIRLATYAFLRQISLPAHIYYGLGDRLSLSIQVLSVKV